MADTVYITSRCGIHRRELCGVFTTLAPAVQLADAAIEHEPDNHHKYEVVAMPVGFSPDVEGPYNHEGLPLTPRCVLVYEVTRRTSGRWPDVVTEFAHTMYETPIPW